LDLLGAELEREGAVQHVEGLLGVLVDVGHGPWPLPAREFAYGEGAVGLLGDGQ
jgi:hypothetical protein